MRAGDLVELDRPARTIDDAHGFIVGLAEGKAVLNVGAAGNVADYAAENAGSSLHARIEAAAASTLALDIDEDSMAELIGRGHDGVIGNAETVSLGRSFDLIVMSDVIEHVDNPGMAIDNMIGHLAPQGRLVVTTPNATAWSAVARSVLGISAGVYWDHVAVYQPEHFQALCDRRGYSITDMAMFSDWSRESRPAGLKRMVSRLVTGIAPRLHGWFLCIVEKAD